MLTFATLENSRPPVKEFMLTMAVQSLGLFLLTYVGLLSTGVLPVPARAYRYIPLVATSIVGATGPVSMRGVSCRTSAAGIMRAICGARNTLNGAGSTFTGAGVATREM